MEKMAGVIKARATEKTAEELAKYLAAQLQVSSVPIVTEWFDSERDPSDQIVAQGNLPVIDLHADYCDMCIQFSYITMFTISWPFCPVLGAVNNYFEIRGDAWRCLIDSRRPIPRRPYSEKAAIGAWEDCLLFETIISILIVALIFSLSTGQIEAWLQLFLSTDYPPTGNEDYINEQKNGSTTCMTVNVENARYNEGGLDFTPHEDINGVTLENYMGPNLRCFGGEGNTGWRWFTAMFFEHVGYLVCFWVFRSIQDRSPEDMAKFKQQQEDQRDMLATTIFGPRETDTGMRAMMSAMRWKRKANVGMKNKA